MIKGSSFSTVTSEKVLTYDIQVLFGKSMKSTDVLKELLPTGTMEIESDAKDSVEGLDSLESWLEGLQNG